MDIDSVPLFILTVFFPQFVQIVPFYEIGTETEISTCFPS